MPKLHIVLSRVEALAVGSGGKRRLATTKHPSELERFGPPPINQLLTANAGANNSTVRIPLLG
jgi:hypothetical protein